MKRQSKRGKHQHTNPDHRPMIPEFRGPQDLLHLLVCSVRRRYDEVNPNDRINWR